MLFFFPSFETVFLWVTFLVVLELSLYTRLALNSQISAYLPRAGLKACATMPAIWMLLGRPARDLSELLEVGGEKFLDLQEQLFTPLLNTACDVTFHRTQCVWSGHQRHSQGELFFSPIMLSEITLLPLPEAAITTYC